jgi:hypothetical protein
VAQSGDVVKIDAGDYRGDVTTWSASNLTICGAGGRPRLFADGKSAQGKGIWVIGGSNVTVDRIAFHESKVPDQNGAGIRAEHGGFLLIRNSGFFDNEDGILGGEGSATITVEGSEFARSGYGDGQSHNIYVGTAAKLTVTGSYFHEAKIGHNLKSRAKETRIENSYFMDGPNGSASYQVDTPNGGLVYLRGNVFQKGPNADNSIAVAYGAEIGSQYVPTPWPVNTLEMVHNTIVMTRSGGTFLAAPASTQAIKLTANLFAGTNNPGLITGGFASGNIVQQNNFTSTAANITAPDNIASPNFFPNATLLALIGLASVPDATYTKDAPSPFTLRTITPTTRLIGALQSRP